MWSVATMEYSSATREQKALTTAPRGWAWSTEAEGAGHVCGEWSAAAGEEEREGQLPGTRSCVGRWATSGIRKRRWLRTLCVNGLKATEQRPVRR